jgi:hypothetical protein
MPTRTYSEFATRFEEMQDAPATCSASWTGDAADAVIPLFVYARRLSERVTLDMLAGAQICLLTLPLGSPSERVKSWRLQRESNFTDQ